MSLEAVFGKFAFNKNIAFEIACFLDPQTISKLISSNKRLSLIYRQDVIWWTFLAINLGFVRMAESYSFEGQEATVSHKDAYKSFRELLRHKKIYEKEGYYNVPEKNKFTININGLLGKLPQGRDILAYNNENFDLLSAFQSFFLFEE